MADKDGSDSSEWESDDVELTSAQSETHASGEGDVVLADLQSVDISLPSPSGAGSAKPRRRSKRLSDEEAALREDTHKAELLALLAAQVHHLRCMHDPSLQALCVSLMPSELLDGFTPSEAHPVPPISFIACVSRWFRFQVQVQYLGVPPPARPEPISPTSLARLLQEGAVLAAAPPLQCTLLFGSLLLGLGVRVRLVCVHDANAMSGPARNESGIGWAYATLGSRLGSLAKSPPTATSPHALVMHGRPVAAPHPAAGGVSVQELCQRKAAHGALVWLEVLATKGDKGQEDGYWVHVDMLRGWVDACDQPRSLRAKAHPLTYVVAASRLEPSSASMSCSAVEVTADWERMQRWTPAGPRLTSIQLVDVTLRYASSRAATIRHRKRNCTTDWWPDTLVELNQAWLPEYLRSLPASELLLHAGQCLLSQIHAYLLWKHGSGEWGTSRIPYDFKTILSSGLAAACDGPLSLPPPGFAAQLWTSFAGRWRSGEVVSALPPAVRASLSRTAVQADAREKSALSLSHLSEPMPTSKTGFKNHPVYALASQCGQAEVVRPSGKEHAVGTFKGEWVYLRSSVHKLLSRERWLMLHSRAVLDSAVPVRVHTRKRRPQRPQVRGGVVNPALRRQVPSPEEAKSVEVELFGEWQTKPFQPAAVGADGRIPVNEYGNVEVWGGRPDMVPRGAVHLAGMPGLPSLASKMGVDWARAVTGFQRKAGRVVPIEDGIVVPEHAATTLRDAWETMQAAKAEAEAKKRSKRAWSGWKRIILAARSADKLRARHAAMDARLRVHKRSRPPPTAPSPKRRRQPQPEDRATTATGAPPQPSMPSSADFEEL